MNDDHRERDVERLERLEEIAETQECALRETLGEMREEIEELREESEHRPYEITVNNRPVSMKGHEHTGLEIKAAAIAAGVSVKPDFVLSEELSHGRSRIVGDEQRIHVDAGARFEAIPNDDHS